MTPAEEKAIKSIASALNELNRSLKAISTKMEAQNKILFFISRQLTKEEVVKEGENDG